MPVNTNHRPIHEHCCDGEEINFHPCGNGVGSVDFCDRFLGEEVFKNNIDKRGWVGGPQTVKFCQH